MRKKDVNCVNAQYVTSEKNNTTKDKSSTGSWELMSLWLNGHDYQIPEFYPCVPGRNVPRRGRAWTFCSININHDPLLSDSLPEVIVPGDQIKHTIRSNVDREISCLDEQYFVILMLGQLFTWDGNNRVWCLHAQKWCYFTRSSLSMGPFVSWLSAPCPDDGCLLSSMLSSLRVKNKLCSRPVQFGKCTSICIRQKMVGMHLNYSLLPIKTCVWWRPVYSVWAFKQIVI